MDEQQAVNTAESAPVEQAEVKEAASSEQQGQKVPETPPATPPSAGQPTVDLYDEDGVPWKNRAMEWKRKVEDLAEKIPVLVQQGFQQKQQDKEYTIGDLEAYALDHPEHRPWVEEQKEKIRTKNILSQLDEKLQSEKKQQHAEMRRQQSLQYVMQNYPDAFQRNESGQCVGWNSTSPITKQIGQIMQDPRFANDPEGLIAAADIAYARIARQTVMASANKEQKLKDEVKSLQKATMVEGGGRQGTQSLPTHLAAIERVKQTGSIKDAVAAIAAINKARREAMEQGE